MPIDSNIYNNMIIEMINSDRRFDVTEHFFLFTNKASFEISKQYENVYFTQKSFSCILKEALEIDYIFIHGLNISFFQEILIKKDIAHKLIWCVWGHDLYRYSSTFNKESANKIKRYIQRYLVKFIEIPFVKKFYAIAYGFTYDQFEIGRLFGDKIKIFEAPYGLGYNIEEVKKVRQNIVVKKDKECINVMIGHCGYPFLNHIEVLELLKKYRDKNIIIYLPLNYGLDEYIKEIEQYLEDYPIKTILLKEKLAPLEYLNYIAKMDIAIFDFTRQAALANIQLLLYFGKKVYLNREGIVYKGLKIENKIVFDIADIYTQNFEEFSNICDELLQNKLDNFLVFDNDKIINDWLEMLEYCKVEKKK